MKINKITLLVCSILTVVSGLTMVVIESTVPDNIDTSLCQSVVSGIFTGFIVSLVISVIGYFHERNIILEQTDSNIKSLYINMMVLSKGANCRKYIRRPVWSHCRLKIFPAYLNLM